MTPTMTAVVATALSTESADRIRAQVPGITLIHEPELLPPMRFPADFEGDPSWHRSPDQQARFDELLDGADALFGIPELNPQQLKRVADRNPRLRWVHTTAAGGGAQVRAAQLDAEQLQRVQVTTSAGVHGDMLAEFAVLGVFAGAKDLGRLRTLQSERRWAERWEMRRVSDLRILVLGLGGIGGEVVTRLHALGADVSGSARHERQVPGLSGWVPVDQLADHIGSFDAVICTLPGTAATERLLNDEVFQAMRPGTIFVNVGRGTVVDEPALIRALDAGAVGFAALDVVAAEPLSGSSPLWAMPNVLISPHTAALSITEETRIADLFADNAIRFTEGRALRNLVDTVEFY